MSSAGMVSKWVLEQYIPKVPVQKQTRIGNNRKGKTNEFGAIPDFKSTNMKSGTKILDVWQKSM